MHTIKEYIKTHKETITIILVLSFLIVFAVASYLEEDNIFSFVYMIFTIVTSLKIILNKIIA